MHRTRTVRVTTGWVLALVTASALVAGCSGDSGDEAATSGDAAAPAGAEDRDSAGGGEGEAGRDGSAASGRILARVQPAGRDIVYSGEVSVRVKDVGRAADRAEALVRAVDGVVFSAETFDGDDDGEGGESATARLTLRVPTAEFRPVLRRIAGLGERLSQSQTAEDVTTQMVDTRSRLATQERSVARVRALLDRADTVGQVVQVEAEVAKREADLESLQAQLARLEDVTALATIEVHLVGPSTDVVETDELGFLSGVRSGWDAFVQIALVALTVTGALLPFLVTAALIGLPAWLVLRSRRLRPAPAGEPPPGP